MHEMTISEWGPLGIVWQKHTASPRGTPMTFAVVKSVKPGGSAALAGVRPFETLTHINGATVAPLEFPDLIDTIRKTRPLRLSFAPLEHAWLRAELLFAAPGPLGLKLEPATGDPRAHGVRLKAITPTSPHASLTTGVLQRALVVQSAQSREVTPGMVLAGIRDHSTGGGPLAPLNSVTYTEAIATLKAASRPLTIYFDPATTSPATPQSAVTTAGGAASSSRSGSSNGAAAKIPTWSPASEQAVRAFLHQHQGDQVELTSRVCEAFDSAQYPPKDWVQELMVMQGQGELVAFMASVASDGQQQPPLKRQQEAAPSVARAPETAALVQASPAMVPPRKEGPSTAPPSAASTATAAAAAVAPAAADAVAPRSELEQRARAYAAADEHHKALSLLEDHTETVLGRLLQVAEAEVADIREKAAAKQSAEAAAAAAWQERAETAEAAARSSASLAAEEKHQRSRRSSSERNRSLEEICEALQLRVEYCESQLQEKDQAHQAELTTRDILLRATELELERAYKHAHAPHDPATPASMPRLPPPLPQDAQQAKQEPEAAAAAAASTPPPPPSFFKSELERMEKEQRRREEAVRSETLAMVAQERAEIDAKHKCYEDVVEEAYDQILKVFEGLPRFDERAGMSLEGGGMHLTVPAGVR
jgi:hypothetical protein